MSVETYLFGVYLVFFLNLFKIIFAIYKIKSTLAKNLEKIGIFYNFRSFKFTSNKPPTILNILLTISFYLFVSPFFSWLVIIYRYFKYLFIVSFNYESNSKYKYLIKSMSKKNLTNTDIENIKNNLHLNNL